MRVLGWPGKGQQNSHIREFLPRLLSYSTRDTRYLVEGCVGAVVVVLDGGVVLCGWFTAAAGGVVSVEVRSVANIATIAIIPAIRTAPMM